MKEQLVRTVVCYIRVSPFRVSMFET